VSEETLLIADPEKAIAVAGVMGGQNSEIGELTERIVIESANFDPVSVRRTAARLGLRTEASNRFEKSIDPELTVTGIAGCVSYLEKLLPSLTICSKLADVFKVRRKKVVISLNTKWVSKLLGAEVTGEAASDILRRLEFDVEEQDRGNLVEEVGRIYGYNNIDPVLPRIESSPVHRNEQLFLIRRLKTLLSNELGLTEVFSYSFQEEAVLDLFYKGKQEFVSLRNPISSTLSKMRRSLIPGLFSFIEKNFTFSAAFSLFEIGSVYGPKRGSEGLPAERKTVAALILREQGACPVFFHAKGRLERLFSKLGLNDVAFVPFDRQKGNDRSFDIAGSGSRDSYHPGRSSLLVSGKICFGLIAELNPRLLKAAGVDFHTHRIAVFELDLSLIGELMKKESSKKYEAIPRFPEVVLALACVVDEDVYVKEVENFIRSYRSELLKNIELFDIYRGKPLAEGKKSLAFNLYYRKEDRTLTEDEANKVHEKIAGSIRKHGWELR
jgi:phenylalanyl-tRNA synthetase beta chain